MRSLGLDIGDRRTGVAISDPLGLIAFPLALIADKDEQATIDEIIKFAEQYRVERIVIGLPYCLNGGLGQQAEKVKTFAEKLSRQVRVNVEMWDERLSTIAAEQLMTEAGTKREKRKQQRDAMAAAYILQGFLDSLSLRAM